jgi:hypothetical protein
MGAEAVLSSLFEGRQILTPGNHGTAKNLEECPSLQLHNSHNHEEEEEEGKGIK